MLWGFRCWHMRHIGIVYSIEVKEPYTIKEINYTCSDLILSPDVLPDTVNSLISVDDNFDLDILQAERKRVETNLKNKGQRI